MSYSTLMVHLDLAQSNAKRLRVAGELAEQFDARAIGVAASDIQPLYFLDSAAGQELLDKDRERLRSLMADCEKEFRQALRGRGDRIEWRCGTDRPGDFVVREARATDLIIVGALRGRSDLLRRVDPGELALRAGRPVLVVPPEFEFLKLSTILVAWKDTREARRAISDALPLLHKANEVVVVELLEPNADQAAARSRVDDISAWLVRRGINAAAIATKALIGVPDQLAIMAHDEGANVIVAGAYGHTRFQEWAFGGVTRTLLQQDECCVLLSH
jgi:nucleotide-binding universal stress UspA family protein